jgi:predicted metal-dependent HD superfamily phosphohydrolase
VDALDQDWRRTARVAGATASVADVDRAGAQLLDRWAEPHRRYHDRLHLAEVLIALDQLADLADDIPAVRLAAWFHDAVYEGQPGVDEQASAALAERVLGALGVPADRVRQVARLVRLTAGHDPGPGDGDGQVLCDADLAILAAPAARYASYAAAVRAEYAHVPDDAFRAGRAAVLRGLGEGPIYRTDRARRRWEAAARANLDAELRALLA